MVIKMNDNLIGIQISKFRKAAGMTQEGLSRLCRLVWASVKHLLDDGLGIPEMGYLETCLPDMGDGLNRLMLS